MSVTTARKTVKTRAKMDTEYALCERCGYVWGEEWHHRQNRSQGGKWDPSNGLWLCSPCHKRVTEHPAEACTWGWSVRGWMDPELMPVVMPRRGGWVWLDDDGGAVPLTAAEIANMELPQFVGAA
jgi:hypothetical protein